MSKTAVIPAPDNRRKVAEPQQEQVPYIAFTILHDKKTGLKLMRTLKILGDQVLSARDNEPNLFGIQLGNIEFELQDLEQ